MSARLLVDWALAERLALTLARLDGEAARFEREAIDAACADATRLVLGYTRLRPAAALPPPELVDRAQWAQAGLRTLRELSEPLERRFAGGLTLPGPLGGVARALMGAATGAEAGVAVGYASRKVLGQYDVALVRAERPPRLLFIAPNLESAHAALGEDPDLFLRWIAIHEVTHAVQFGTVGWLRDHLAALVEELVEGASASLDAGWVRQVAGRLLRSDPRSTVRAILRGDLPRILAGGEQVEILDRIQAAMAVIEGYAEHVMDAVAVPLDPGYTRLRDRLEARRASRGGLGEVIARLLGLDLKLRQYRLGKSFCDAVAAEAGIEGLNDVWAEPEALPSLEELEDHGAWLLRRGRAPAAASQR